MKKPDAVNINLIGVESQTQLKLSNKTEGPFKKPIHHLLSCHRALMGLCHEDGGYANRFAMVSMEVRIRQFEADCDWGS
ncbi:uncharacterized protein HKW66_Vig0106030 [Vigna angularis]|uniref:Uncharacterized protein n=1 Tax=Phaseolus angularis TaxID=3914 RepID=A0A8T0KIS3_PHAAN|nr:uncharacterized protein HKW66_Vig0106030 [Vigna angularis]